MRFSHPASEKAQWPKAFLGLLQEASPEYVRNRLARGIKTECLREVGGARYSQNTICLHGTYHHCFAVSLTPLVCSHLNSPFWVGARFDHNHTIFCAFERDLGLPVRGPDAIPGLHSTHKWRTGTDDIVRKCTANAEKHLGPHYLREVALARPLLLRVVQFLIEHPTIFEDEALLAAYSRPFVETRDLSLNHFAHPPTEWSANGALLPQALVASFAHKFSPHGAELSDIYRRLEALAAA